MSKALNERTMHVTWLVSDPNAFFLNPGPTSPKDRIIPYGLTYDEWYSLFFVVLGADAEKIGKSRGSKQDTRPLEFEQDIPGYPMLSYIRGPYYDAVFEGDEVQLLEDECSRLLPIVSNSRALSGLQKLLKIIAQAKEFGLSIFLMCE